KEGCAHFGVATISEARELRETGLRTRLYLLGGFFPEYARTIVDLDLTPFVFDVSLIPPLDAAARSLGRRDFPIHLKIDTGATRLGVMPADLRGTLDQLRRATALRLEGVCTLMANAGDAASTATAAKLRVVDAAVASIRKAGFDPSV